MPGPEISNEATGAAIAPKLGPDAFDPVTFSVILSRLNAIVAEMTTVLERSAWSSVIALAHDYSCGIYDGLARQVSMFDALPIHTTSMQLVVQEIARSFDRDLHPGDVFLCNDPHSYNTHIGDLVTAAPVFRDGRLAFWSVTKGHQLDTGAFVPASATASSRSVWQEGLTIPPTKLVEGGSMREDVLRLYLANMRYRDVLEGDLRAQIGSIERGRQRLDELCDEYGTEVILAYVGEIIDYADRRMTAEMEEVPDGEYVAEAWIDSDGIEANDIPVKAKITVDGSGVIVDYSDSGPQGKGGVNGTYASAMAAGAIPFLYYIDPDIPHNQGCIDHIEVIAVEGTICWAAFPASTSTATVVPSDLMQDVVNRAMAQAIPDRVIAGGARCQNVIQFSGEADLEELPWGLMVFNGAGGFGASKGTDGWPLCSTQAALGAMKISSVEQLELRYPIHLDWVEVEPDSMGAGEWIGGPGISIAVKPLVEETVAIAHGDGSANPPHGVVGGRAGIGGGQYIEDRGTGRRRYVSVNGNMRIAGGQEAWVGISTGGGGFGPPHRRPIEAVRADVRDGIVSRAAALAVYGVALDDAPDPQVDEAATEAARRSLEKLEQPLVEPVVPGASTWLESHMREGDVYLLNPQPFGA